MNNAALQVYKIETTSLQRLCGEIYKAIRAREQLLGNGSRLLRAIAQQSTPDTIHLTVRKVKGHYINVRLSVDKRTVGSKFVQPSKVLEKLANTYTIIG